MHRYDALIIGSGISSLVCASLLAKRGKKVCVLEKYRKLGGYLHSFERFGCRYDTGSHYIGSMQEGQSFRSLLQYLGAFRESMFVPLNEQAFDIFKFPDFSCAMPKGHKNAAEAIAQMFPEDREGLHTYFDMIRTIADSIPTYQYDDEADANKVLEYLNTPLSSVVDRLIKNPRTKLVLYAYCTLHCVHPDDTPFAFHAVMIDSLLRGAHGFREGGDALAEILVDSITQQGGDVFPRKQVSAMTVNDQNIVSVRTAQGEEFSAEWIISGIHPKHTFDLVGREHLPRSFLSRLDKMKQSVPFLGIYAATHSEPKLNPLSNYYCFTSQDFEQSDVLRNPEQLKSNHMLASYVARNNRSSIPGKKGFHPLTLHAPANYAWFETWRDSRFADRPADYHAFKDELAETILSTSDNLLGFDRSEIAHLEVSTPLSNEHYNGSLDGSAYGIYHSIDQTGMRGLGPRTHIKNLLLTGQNTLFPGLLGSAISGLRSAGHIVGIKPILKELKQLQTDRSTYS